MQFTGMWRSLRPLPDAVCEVLSAVQAAAVGSAASGMLCSRGRNMALRTCGEPTMHVTGTAADWNEAGQAGSTAAAGGSTALSPQGVDTRQSMSLLLQRDTKLWKQRPGLCQKSVCKQATAVRELASKTQWLQRYC